MPRGPRPTQAGFTLIELMIGMVVSSLLIAMVLSIVFRMSATYRTQAQVSEMQQILASAAAQIRQDTKVAGYGMPNGFEMPSALGTTYTAPIQFVTGGASAPDQIRLYWADSTKQARVLSQTSPTPGMVATPGAISTLQVDSTVGFAANDVVVISNLSTQNPSEPAVVGEPPVATFRTCVVQITSLSATTLNLATSGVYGTGTNNHCNDVRTDHVADGGSSDTMVYGFVARAYRIDTTRPTLGVLQLSPSGGLVASDWQDIGVGFTDMQVAARYYDGWTTTSLADSDGDGDTTRDWYSTFTAIPSTALWPTVGVLPVRFGPFPQVLEANITFVARTLRAVGGVATSTLPIFGGQLGDQTAAMPVSVDGNGAPDFVYRYITAHIDFRNMAVSR